MKETASKRGEYNHENHDRHSRTADKGWPFKFGLGNVLKTRT